MKKKWKEIEIASIVEGGTSTQFKTGDWRSAKPIWNEEKCKQCLICWLFCPDSSIKVEDGKMKGMKYDFCKGCGICAKECPFGAITMEEEKK